MIGKKLVLTGLTAVLGTGIGWGLAARKGGVTACEGEYLDIPETVVGYNTQELNVADTPEMVRTVEEVLDYDRALLREYVSPTGTVLLYFASWAPGKTAHRSVAAHTPDICWVQNGWQRRRGLESDAAHFAALQQATGLTPGQFRVFERGSQRQYVLFWHKVGNKILNYSTDAEPPWWAVLWDLRTFGLHQRDAQLFVRISSERPLDAIWTRPEWRHLVTALIKAGLDRPVASPY